MKTLLFGLFTCLSAQLVFGAAVHEHSHADHSHADHGHADHHTDHHVGHSHIWKIYLHILSGSDKTYNWIFRPKNVKNGSLEAALIRELDKMGHPKDGLKTGGKLRTLPSGVTVTRNGYRGLTIEHLKEDGTVIHQWMMYCVYAALEASLVVKTPNQLSPEVKLEVVKTLTAECKDAKPAPSSSNTQSTASGSAA